MSGRSSYYCPRCQK
ncbi:MAG: hypothetical protein JW854_00080 [Actinobacteria bacterium]|nr:hypothetical protein [Actinomycetota bacterium]